MANQSRTGLSELVQLSFFADVGKAITSTRSIRGTLREVMHQIGNIFAPQYWSLLLRHPKSGELKFVVVIGSGVEELQGKTIRKGQGVAGWIAEHGEPVMIEDVERDRRFDSAMDQLTDFHTKSIIGVPLRSHGRVFGVIELINKLNGDTFSALDLKTLSTIADFAAIAIEKAYYFRALKRIALVDALTGAYNRRSLTRFLEREIERAKRRGASLSLLVIDVDRFKEINDTYGHLAGDAVLRNVAEALRRSVRKIDVICRYGGDEFVVLMPDTDERSALDVEGRLVRSLATVVTPSGSPVEVSIGHYSGTPDSAEEVFDAADLEMYREKAGRSDQDIDDLSNNIGDFIDEEPEHDEDS